ncbi:putative mitochondrial ribosomal protein L23 [Aspergillus unguis]
MVRKLTKFPPKPAGWVSPSAPLSQRKQIYLPNFTVALIRTPFLPPRFASFYVPLNFNKLDMRDYLQRAYGVGVISVRSTVEQQKVTREKTNGKFGYGKWRRPKSRKRMTVEMDEPFVWPELPESMEAWEKDQFFKAAQYQKEVQDTQRPEAPMQEPKDVRAAYEEEAKKLLGGEKAWRPTWQALGLSYDRTGLGTPGKGPGSS